MRLIIISKCQCQGFFAEVSGAAGYIPPSECPDCGGQITTTYGIVKTEETGVRGKGLTFDTIQPKTLEKMGIRGYRYSDYEDDDLESDCTPSFEGGYWTDPNDPTA